jgi:MFS family permease
MTARSPGDKRSALSPSEAFSALRHRNYRLYFAGQFISMSGTWLQMVAQGWLVWRLTGNELAVGTVTACGSLPMLLLSLAGGTLADRVDRRRLLLVTQSLSMVLAALLGFLSLLPGLQIWHVAAVAACLGTVNAFDVPTRQSFVVEMVDREALMNAIALNSLLFNGARVLGPMFASIMVAMPHVGVPGCFFLNSLSYVAALIAIARIRIPRGERIATGQPPVAAAAEGVRYALGTPVLRRLITLLFIVGVFGWSISVLIAPMADRVLKGGVHAYGWLLTANGVGAVAGSLLLAFLGDTPHRRRLVYGGLAFLCFGLVGFSLSRWLPVSIVMIACYGMGTIVFSATSNTVVQSTVPDALRGRVMGVWALVFAGSTPIGSLQAGIVARLLGAPAALQIGAGMMAAAGALVFRTSQQERARNEHRVAAQTAPE